MSDNKKNLMNEEDGEQEQDIVVFEDEDGNEYEFTPVDYFFYNGDEYCLLTEILDADEEEDPEGTEVIVCKVTEEKNENGEDEDVFSLVEDEELAAKLVEIANTKMNEDEEE